MAIFFELGFILAVAGSALAFLIRDYIRYARESALLETLQRQVKRDFRSPDDFLLAVQAPDKLEAASMVHERVNVVHRLIQAHLPVPIAELSDLTAEGAEISWNHRVPRFAFVGLIVLGVGTTFFNLQTTLGQTALGAVVVNGTFNDARYQQAVEVITAGFGHAFTASIFAIFGTAGLLLVQSLFTNPAKESFFHRLDVFTQSELVPILLGFAQRSTQEELVFSVVQKLEGVIEDFRSLSTNLNTSIGATNQATKSLAGFGGALGKVVEDFATAIGGNSKFHATMEHLHAAVSASETRHRELLGHFDKLTGNVGQQSVNLLQTQGLVGELQAVVLHSEKTFAEGVRDFVHGTEKSVKGLHQEWLSQTKGPTDELAACATAARALLESLVTTSRTVQTQLDAQQTRQDTLAETTRETLAKLTPAIKTLHEKIGRFEVPSLQIIEQLGHLRTLERLPPALDIAVKDFMAGVNTSVTAFQAHISAQEVHADAARQTLSAEWRQAAESLARLEPLVAYLDQIAASLFQIATESARSAKHEAYALGPGAG